MHRWRTILALTVLTAGFGIGTLHASQFVVFPKASELISPDGRYAVRNVDAARSASDFAGTFHSLWLFELPTGRSRKLCDYLGVASVAWSNNDFLIVTQYLSRRTSRALVFPMTATQDAVMLDKTTLTAIVPPDLRPALRENDHVFVEGSRVEQNILHLTVWGYGPHDPNGFRCRCEYSLPEGTITCSEERGSH